MDLFSFSDNRKIGIFLGLVGAMFWFLGLMFFFDWALLVRNKKKMMLCSTCHIMRGRGRGYNNSVSTCTHAYMHAHLCLWYIEWVPMHLVFIYGTEVRWSVICIYCCNLPRQYLCVSLSLNYRNTSPHHNQLRAPLIFGFKLVFAALSCLFHLLKS